MNIYTGAITDWSELAAVSCPILPTGQSGTASKRGAAFRPVARSMYMSKNTA